MYVINNASYISFQALLDVTASIVNQLLKY